MTIAKHFNHDELAAHYYKKMQQAFIQDFLTSETRFTHEVEAEMTNAIEQDISQHEAANECKSTIQYAFYLYFKYKIAKRR